jgi:small-conductance mechanosensitive channel
MFKGFFSDNYFLDKTFLSIAFGIMFFIAKYLATKAVRTANKPWTAEQRLRWIGYLKSVSFGVLILGILFIWGEQLHNFAVSLFAIAFAVVFSVKELFMCFNGSLMRFRGNVFNLGDRIEINGFRGDVIDFNLISTTLLETGPGSNSHHYTGRMVTFPNSMLLGNFIMNESFMDHFFLHNILIPIKLEENWIEAKKLLLKIAQDECSPFLDQARKRAKEAARQRSVQLPSVEPRIIVKMIKPGKAQLIVRVPAPIHLKGRLEQTILNKFLEKFYPYDSTKPLPSEEEDEDTEEEFSMDQKNYLN